MTMRPKDVAMPTWVMAPSDSWLMATAPHPPKTMANAPINSAPHFFNRFMVSISGCRRGFFRHSGDRVADAVQFAVVERRGQSVGARHGDSPGGGVRVRGQG